MLEWFAFWTVIWPLRTFYYPVIRLLGRFTGREKLARRFIEVGEKNIERTVGVLEGDDQ